MNRPTNIIPRARVRPFIIACVMVAATGLLAMPARAATKVAILASDKAGNQVAALAETLLTADGRLAVVDRTSVDHVVEEQKLSLVNIDAQTTVKIGQLLNADLFAVIEPGTQGSSPPGMVVFDAGSGLRLEDISLPQGAEKSSQAVASAIIAASQKIHPNKGTLLPVCVVAVRNADLPLSMDPACEAMGLLLERRLVSFAGIGVLERRSLEAVNKERNLPTTWPVDALWSSMVTIDLQISKKDSAGLKALAVLSNSRGVEIGRIESSVDVQDVAALSNAVAEALARQLKIASTSNDGDSVLEAHRFQTEATFLGELGDFAGALRDAEAAMALHKTPDTQVVLIQCLLRRAIQLINFNVSASYLGNIPVSVPVDQVTQSHAMFDRAIDLFATLDPPVLGRTRPQQRNVSDHIDFFYQLAKLYLNDSRNLRQYSSEVQQANLALRQKFLSTAIDRIKAWKALGPRDEAEQGCESEINSMTGVTNESLAADAQSPAEYIDDLTMAFKPWLELLAEFQKTGRFPADASAINIGALRDDYTKGVSPIYSSFMTDPVIEARRKAFYKTLCDHPYPPIQLYGYAATDTPGAFFDRVCRTIENPGAEPADSIRDQCYRVALDRFGQYNMWHNGSWPFAGISHDVSDEKSIALVKFMLGRKEIDYEVLLDAFDVLQEWDKRGGGNSAIDMLEQAKAVMADPQCHVLSGNARWMTSMLNDWVERAANRRTETAQAANNPFKSVHLLMMPEIVNGGSLFGVTIVDDDIDAATISDEYQNPTLCVWRMTTNGERLKKLGEITLSHSNSIGDEGIECLAGAPVCVRGDSDLFVRMGQRGLMQMPLSGGAVSRLDTAVQLPTADVHAMAWLKGRLYVGMGDGGYIARIDPKAGKCEVLASSRSKEHRSALDNCDAYNIAWMAVDAPRNRLIMWVENFTSDRPTHGFWQMDDAGTIKPFKMFRSLGQFHWASQPRDGVFRAAVGNDGVSIDLTNEKVDAFYAWGPGTNYGGVDDRNAKFLGHDYFPPPYLLIGDSLWSGQRWAKITPGHSPLLTLPSPAAGVKGSDFQAHVCLESIDDGKAIIVAIFQGIWRIDLN